MVRSWLGFGLCLVCFWFYLGLYVADYQRKETRSFRSGCWAAVEMREILKVEGIRPAAVSFRCRRRAVSGALRSW